MQSCLKEGEEVRKKMKELERSIEILGAFIENNIKKSNIPKFIDYFSPNAVKFPDYKEPYRLVVGHVFSKAHKSMSENVLLRSQVKMQLFCCHLINRIFEK